MRWPWTSSDDWRWLDVLLDVEDEPVTRDEILTALVHLSETRLRLQLAGAPHDCVVRMGRRIDHLLDRLGAFD